MVGHGLQMVEQWLANGKGFSKKRFAKNGFPKTVCQETVFRKRCSKTRFFCHNNVFPPRTVFQTCFSHQTVLQKCFLMPKAVSPKTVCHNGFPKTVFQKRFSNKINDLPRNGLPQTASQQTICQETAFQKRFIQKNLFSTKTFFLN